ncbi:MAG: penicillin acylase family protein [Pseudomonadales bacterium]|nr:penicillin acylase family protein [Pseudomonadales bacterium]
MIKKIALSLLSILLLVIVSGYFYLGSKEPTRDGSLTLIGLQQPVTVSYDHYGIPHITASNDHDLYMALGYVHAQDRLFQMEMTRRLSQGKLAEILGEKLIGVDKLYRTLGLESYGKRWLKAIQKRADPRMLNMLNNYLKGVNQFATTGPTPLEFDLLGIPTHQYTLIDIASISGFVSFSFAQGIEDDSLTHHLYQKLGANYMVDLGIEYTPGFEKIPVDPRLTKNLSSTINHTINSLQAYGLFHGSNSWLIAPKRSASGHAIFVNDPHIGFSQPSVWYEAQLSSDTTDLYGHFMGLIPFPLLGMSQHHAWGLTMFENDDTDLYLEKINPENSNQYWAIDHWQEFKSRTEVIKVKDSDDIKMTVLSTRHGPIINQLFDELKGSKHGLDRVDQPVALWWAFLNTDNQMVEAFYNLGEAHTVDKAQKAASMIHAPGLNVMYANANGDIAWWAAAKLPIRPSHVNSKLILDGASGKDDQLGSYDFSHNPQQINPESGLIYTANNQPADMGDGLVPGYYAPTDRPSRILELLSTDQKFTPEQMKSMLMDNTTPTAKLFQSTIIPVLENDESTLSPVEIQALDAFKAWHGNHSSDETAATIYNRFRIQFMNLAMADEMSDELYSGTQFGFLIGRSIWRMLPNENSVWWDNINTEQKETRDQLILEAWHLSITFLVNRFGPDLNQWSWGEDTKLLHEHPLGVIPLLGNLLNVGPFPNQAGQEAINNLGFKADGDNLKITVGPSTRRVIDFGDIENSWGINPTGQSGLFTDQHYDDQAHDYVSGKFRHHYITPEKVQNNLESELMLLP